MGLSYLNHNIHHTHRHCTWGIYYLHITNFPIYVTIVIENTKIAITQAILVQRTCNQIWLDGLAGCLYIWRVVRFLFGTQRCEKLQNIGNHWSTSYLIPLRKYYPSPKVTDYPINLDQRHICKRVMQILSLQKAPEISI